VSHHKLVIATYNRGKLHELQDMLADLPLEICELSSFPSIRPVPETGATFTENAALKATGYASQTHLFTLADDSGLEVDALKGAPGVLSARYLHPHASDADRIERILAGLADVPDPKRTARFVSVIAIADCVGKIINTSVGTCEGRISSAPAGSNGFGYDPIFIPNGFNETFGELPAEVKNRISHRARALAEARAFLRTLTASSGAG
jgi:XTP/dITP diphosphohydrolase